MVTVNRYLEIPQGKLRLVSFIIVRIGGASCSVISSNPNIIQGLGVQA